MPTILCADSDPLMRQLYQHSFWNKRNFNVKTADSPKHALDIIRKSGIDLLVTERRLASNSKDRSGIDLCRTAVLEYHVPAGLVSCRYNIESHREKELAESLASGALPKPFGLADLRTFINGLLIQRQGRKPRILIVEDDAGTRNLYRNTFENHNYSATCAQSAEDALKKIRSGKRYDIILTDLNMNGMSGLDLAKKLRNSHTVIIGSGNWEEEQRIAARGSGAVALYSKPFSPDDLARLVHKYFPAHPLRLKKAL